MVYASTSCIVGEGGGGRATQFMHSQSHMTIDSRILAMPGRRSGGREKETTHALKVCPKNGTRAGTTSTAGSLPSSVVVSSLSGKIFIPGGGGRSL